MTGPGQPLDGQGGGPELLASPLRRVSAREKTSLTERRRRRMLSMLLLYAKSTPFCAKSIRRLLLSNAKLVFSQVLRQKGWEVIYAAAVA